MWYRRWRVSCTGPWPEGARIAALGAAGRRALEAAAPEGWTPSPGWDAAPPVVRETTPAVRGADGTLLAVPLADYTEARLAAAGCAISAQFAGWRELPSQGPTE